jgi:hypothetical protein
MAIVAIPGKVYLRDTRNGNVYEFERNLAQMSFVEQVVLVPAEPEPEPEVPVEPEKPVEPVEPEQKPTVDEAATAEVKAAAPPPPPSGKKK